VISSREVLDELETVLSQVRLGDLPALLGHLERLRLAATLRLMAGLRALPPPVSPPDPTVCLAVAQVAERLHTSRWNVYDAIKRGKLCALRDGRRVLVRQVDLEAYVRERLDGRRTGGTS
jgi:excisionase family DNA binding protein